MSKILRRLGFIAIFSVTMIASPLANAQDGGGSEDYLGQSLGDLMIVGGAGIGGAVLGLSTLSFVEVPGKHLKNVLVGGAIGIIVGVGVVAYMQATKSQGAYEGTYNTPAPSEFNTIARNEWHQVNHEEHQSSLDKEAVSFQFAF